MKKIISVLSRIITFTFTLLIFSSYSLASEKISVPSIEKLFQNNTKTIGRGELFYGCIVKVVLGDKDLLKQKFKIKSLEIGNSKKNIIFTLLSDYYAGDDASPKLKDCYVFKSKGKILISIPDMAWGIGEIVKGNFKIENVDKNAPKIIYKKSISVDEYYEDNILYGKRRLFLSGEVDKIEVVAYELKITLVSSEGKELMLMLHETMWEDDEKLANNLRSIKVGTVIKVRGHFDYETEYGNGFKIQNIVDFGN